MKDQVGTVRICKKCAHPFLLEEIKRSTQGKLAAATQVQSADYLKPLFKQLKTRVSYHGIYAKSAWTDDGFHSQCRQMC
jgi:hypothetical protein